MVELVEEVELMAIRESTYTMYVFKKLNEAGYIMCTRMPNWQTPNVSVGDKGFLNYQIVKAGETYYNPDTEERTKYRYSNVYYINFVAKSEIKKQESIII